jgi:hypothetical protein
LTEQSNHPENEANALQKKDLSISMERANLYSLVFAIPVIIVPTALFGFIWGGRRLGVGLDNLVGQLLLFLLVFLGGIVIHELLHAITWALAARKPLRSIKFGFQLKTLTPYAHIKEPIEVNAYRLGALMPGLLIGLLPAVVGILAGSGWWLLVGVMFLTAAGGDMVILWLLRNVPAGRLVEDHPVRAGCYVIEP